MPKEDKTISKTNNKTNSKTKSIEKINADNKLYTDSEIGRQKLMYLTHHVLKRNKVYTIEALQKLHDEKQLIRIRNLGKLAYNDIVSLLESKKAEK